MPRKTTIAVIGAGMAGLRLAQLLREAADVSVFEKSRGLGGRMSTRRSDGFEFDHGAQYFTARGAAFAHFLQPYIARGTVRAWTPRLTSFGATERPQVGSATRYVAVPGMTALAKAMAAELAPVQSAQITSVQRSGSEWSLICSEDTSIAGFDWVISTAPAPQTAHLLPSVFCGQDAVKNVVMQGCYSLMLGFDGPIPINWDAARVGSDPLAWMAVNTSKPERSDLFSLIAQSSNTWAQTHLERDQDRVRAELMDAVSSTTGLDVSTARLVRLHRWRYANVVRGAGAPFLIDPMNRLAAAGDWCGTGKVEAAFDSASALATAIREMIT